MKRILAFLFILLIVLAAGVAYYWYKVTSIPASANQEEIRFVVPKGKSASQIGEALYQAKLIRTPLEFKFYVQMTSRAGAIQAGEFVVKRNMTIPQLVDVFSKAPIQVWVTFPEGLRREQIAAKVLAELKLEPPKAAVFYQEFMKLSEKDEGYFFPDTYLLPRDITPSKLLSLFANTFDRRVDAQMKADALKNGYKFNEVIVMASLIEKETLNLNPEERPLVAGVLYKRLKAGWPLQVDAAVQYAVANSKCKNTTLDEAGKCDWWPKSLSKDDLAINSPFNTYKNTGFPPSPVANPGLDSIKAAIYPKDSEYWYYIHDSKGDIHFAKTIEEHNANIQKYL